MRRPTGTSHKEAHRATFCIRAYDHQERLLPGIPLPSGERIIGSSIGLEKREQVRDPYADLVARTKSLPPGMKASKPEQDQIWRMNRQIEKEIGCLRDTQADLTAAFNSALIADDADVEGAREEARRAISKALSAYPEIAKKIGPSGHREYADEEQDARRAGRGPWSR